MTHADLLPHLLPTLAQVQGHAALVVVALGMIGLGRLVSGRSRLVEFDLLAGWGVVVVVFTLAGTLTTVPFHMIAIGLGIVASAAWSRHVRRGQNPFPPGTGRVLLLLTPLLLLIASMVPSQWDEFSHWLHSGRYLFDVGSLPREGLPENRATYPAYPYGVPLITYLTSLVAGTFVETAQSMLNTLVLAAFALALWRVMALGLDRPDARPSWTQAALVLLGATLLGPTFVPKVVFTAYAEVGSAVAVAASVLLGWLALDRLAEGKRDEARWLSWQMGLVLAALIGMKQATLVLLVLVVAGVALLAARDSRVPKAAALSLAPLMLGPAAAVYLAWRHYVGIHLPGREFVVKALADWEFDLLPTVLRGMGHVAANKGGHFLLILIIAVFAVRGLWRCRTRFDRLAVVAATVLVGYNVFLAWAYIAVFGGYEAEHVASFWRYNMHLGPLETAVTVLGLAVLWRQRVEPRLSPETGRRVGTAVILLGLIAPPALATHVRFDVRANKMYVRAVGTEMNALLPPDARLMVVDPVDTGFYGLMINYLLRNGAKVTDRLIAFQVGDPKVVIDALARRNYTHVWVHTQTKDVTPYLPIPLAEGTSHLIDARGDRWTVIKSWPYPGYRLPTDLPDK